MTSITLTAPTVWTPPTAVRVRGALALVAGAREGDAVYARFGARLAADGYVVGVFGATGDHRELAGRARDWLTAQPVAPRVLAGSDRGAAAALALVADGEDADAVDGLLIAGLPVAGIDDATASDELRTSCPLHSAILRAILRERPSEPLSGADAAAADAHPDTLTLPSAAALAAIGIPVLAIHGGADRVSPIESVRSALAPLDAGPLDTGPLDTGRLEFVEVVDGLHDALNDQSHRSVAATIVLWLERLRAGDAARPIVRTSVAPAAATRAPAPAAGAAATSPGAVR